jgi:hypothetical protein
MASKSTLTQKNLEALGAERLAALLIEISEGNANQKRRLRMELAGVESPAKLVNEIRKRLTSIGAATTFIGWRSLKTFKADLHSQRRLIAEQVATGAPQEALELMWKFICLGGSVLERTTDTSGEVIEIFRQAAHDQGEIAIRAEASPEALLKPLTDAILANGYGQSDTLIRDLAPRLGPDGLQQLRSQLLAAAKEPEARRPVKARKVSRWRRGRKLEREIVTRRSRTQIIHQAQLDIADAMGDVDAYVALQSDLRLPATAAKVAERLLAAGRAAEALTVLDNVRTGLREVRPREWTLARIQALEALDHSNDAQIARLDAFHQSLNPEFLRAYLKRLPDFDDIEAEDEALDFVAKTADANTALDFLITWPALERASRFVSERIAGIDGNDDEIPTIAAEKLAARYPLAAVLLLRKMIEATLNNARSIDYEIAADRLSEAEKLSAAIDDFKGFADHKAYLDQLKAQHARKTDFWDAVA